MSTSNVYKLIRPLTFFLRRGSRDGFSSARFHELCDDKPRTVIVIRVRGTNQIIGGYSPVIWSVRKEYCNTEDSFLFSFGHRGNVQDAHLSRISRSRAYYAIRWNGREYGPCFGDKDLWLQSKFDDEGAITSQKDDYVEGVTDTSVFSCSEFEVFQVALKAQR
jgi:hypothetical protein